jgi:hypothetical protein
MKYEVSVYRSNGEWRWKMISSKNGKIVGASTESFKTKAGVSKNLAIVTGFSMENFEKVSKDLFVFELPN